MLSAKSFLGAFGGVGPVGPSGPGAWVIVIVNVDATAALDGVGVGDLEILDAAGAVVARAQPPLDVRVDSASDAERRRDLSELGTTPFDGKMVASQGLRLRVHAALDARLDVLMKAAPARWRARVFAKGDPGTLVDGKLDPPWPTGGPAPAR